MDDKVTWNPMCPSMNKVWWSLKFCNKRIQIGYFNKNEDNHVTRKVFLVMYCNVYLFIFITSLMFGFHSKPVKIRFLVPTMPVNIPVQLSHILVSFQFIGIHKHFLHDNLVHGEGTFASLGTERGELIVRYTWTGWSARLQQIHQSFKRNLWNVSQINRGKIERCQHATS